MYKKRLNPELAKRRLNITTCIIFAVFATLLTACSVPQTVRYTKTQAHSKKISPKSDLVDNELYLDQPTKGETDKSIKNFEKLLMQRNSTADNANDDKVNAGENSDATTNAPKKLPTLREQMVTLNNNQATINRDMVVMRDEITDIKKSVDEIKQAVYGLNNVVKPNAVAPEKREVVKETPKPKTVKTTTPDVAKTNLLLPNEKTNEKTNEQTTSAATVVANNDTNAPEVAKNDFDLGEQYYNASDYENAVSYLTKVIRKDRNSSNAGKAHYYLGKINYEQKNYNQAISHLKRALTVKGNAYKDNSQALLAEAYIRSGNNNLAKEAYKSLISEYPASKYVPKARKMLQQL